MDSPRLQTPSGPSADQDQITPDWPDENTAVVPVLVTRVEQQTKIDTQDALAVEGPLEIRLQHGPPGARREQSISVTMRTPGSDLELAIGFLLTEGVLSDPVEVLPATPESGSRRSTITIALDESVIVNVATLERNFYTTSSCGICGKASILALRAVCPPRRTNSLTVDSATLFELPRRLRAAQEKFERTGGLHAAGLFNAAGQLESLREDVGRHNAVDKLIGAAALADKLPLRNHILLLSGRASFELLQKALMAGIQMVVAIGAPSSLAVQVAKDFDITLVGFLRETHFNVYNGSERILISQSSIQERS